MTSKCKTINRETTYYDYNMYNNKKLNINF